MTRFILLHRRIKFKGQNDVDIAPTWVNVSNINTIANTVENDGTRITMRDGFLLVEESVAAVLDKIRCADNGG